MVEVVARKPWLLRRFGAQLGELHIRLHALDAPSWMPAAEAGPGTKVIHLDLHPLNVLMAPDGPVVIDWANTARGAPAVDAALTWVLLACGQVPGDGLQALAIRVGRRVLERAFLAAFELTDLRAVVRDVVEWKCRDTNMSEVERARMRALVIANVG
jgi:aminoglycoside phosphotransferase (APT) family kinase protein